ncbi:MAG: hypothetical protein AAF716_14765 [Cyanobacteria bacterium P01_D01_bin.1]
MFGINELILPLLGGYLFITRCLITRYVARLWSGYRLIFNSAIAGACSLIATVVVLGLARQEFPVSVENLSTFFNIPGYSNLGSSLVAFFLANLGWILFNFVLTVRDRLSGGDRQKLSIKYIENYANALQVLLAKSMQETRQVSVSLNSGKVYIGFVTKLNEGQGSQEFILLWPQFSGYRDQETKQLIITRDYSHIYDAIADPTSELSDVTVNDFQTAISVADMYSVSIFNPAVYSRFAEIYEDGDAELEDEQELVGTRTD